MLRKILVLSLTFLLLSSSIFARVAGRSVQLFAPANLITDGGFETGGIPNTFWNPETSTNFGTPLCDVPSCGTGGGASPPNGGSAFWLWFGGIPAPETATIGQTITFPAGEPIKFLVFQMRIGTVSSPFTDVMNVRVDGAIVATFPEPTVAEGAYTERVINLGAFAAGSHAILFEYIGATSGTGSYVIDDVWLQSVTASGVTVGGRIFGTDGRGVTNARVDLTDQGGNRRSVFSGKGGYYQFEDVEAGQTYFLSVVSRKYTFEPRSIEVVDNVSDFNFMPQ